VIFLSIVQFSSFYIGARITCFSLSSLLSGWFTRRV